MAQEHDSNRQRRLREWFMPSGLAECTSCGQRGLVRTGEGDGYCIDCGYVEGATGRPAGAEPRGEASGQPVS